MGCKLKDVFRGDNGLLYAREFWCPGCDDRHHVGVGWQFNGSVDSPTFQPSILVTYRTAEGIPDSICHSYVTNGQIQFLPDCTHEMAGKTVELPDWPRTPVVP